MGYRKLITAIGAGITTFLVVVVAVIELLDFEFSAIIGLPVGVLAGIGGFGLVLFWYGDADEPFRWVAAGVAGFGYGIVVALAVSYVNLVELGVDSTIGIGIALAALGLLGTMFLDRW